MNRATVLLGLGCALVLGCSGGDDDSENNPGSANGGSGGGVPKDCPAISCDDGDSCTVDVGARQGNTCDVVCSHEVITACTGGDGCCSSGCTPDNDSDCGDPTSSPIPAERRIEWRPGIPGGIPSVATVCTTLDAGQYGDGSTDATSAIQAAIDACPEGQAVMLPAGTYRTTGTLRIEKSIVLRGAGPASSKIVLDDSGTEAVLRVGKQSNLTNAVAVVEGMNRGSTRITVADAGNFSVGDVVLIDQKDDPALITTGDCEWFKRSEGGVANARSLGQTVRITGKDGNALELSSPLYYTYVSAHEPEISKPENGTLEGAGVEDLYLGRKTEYGGQGFIIHLVFAAESWVKNVETDKVSGRHISVNGGYRNVIRDSYVHHAWNYNPGANAYGIVLSNDTSDTLVENNIVYYLNIPVSLENSGGGNVIGYNYIDDAIEGDVPAWQCADIVAHCSFSYMELVEGNYAPHVTLDNVHGGSGYITFFRNQHSSEHRTVVAEGNQLAFGLEANALYHNAVGNVLLKEGLPNPRLKDECGLSPGQAVYQFGFNKGGDHCAIDERVEQTVLLHGNFDYVNNSIVWADGLAQELPPSLYLTQKPSFFGDETWPYVDPTRSPMVGTLPAKARFEALP